MPDLTTMARPVTLLITASSDADSPVVHLQNFDIEIVIQRLRDALDQCRQQIDPEAHIAGLDDDGAGRDALDHGVIRHR